MSQRKNQGNKAPVTRKPAQQQTEAVETKEVAGETQAPAVEAVKETAQKAPAVEANKEAPTKSKSKAAGAKDTTGAVAAIVEELTAYAEAMSGKNAMDPVTGARHQSDLHSVFRNMLSLDGGDLFACHKGVLAVIRKHRKDAFSERLICRFFEKLRLGREQRVAFERLINLYLLAADTKDASKLKEFVDIAETIKSWPDGDAQQKLTSIFG